MKKIYRIEGMTCNGCRSHVENTLLKVEGVILAEVDLIQKEASIEMTTNIPIEKFQKALNFEGGAYRILED